MKITIHILLCILFTSINATSQGIAVDLLLNTNKENFEFQLENIVHKLTEEKEDGCISFNIINDRSEGSSPYIIELWESEEFVKQYIFKKNRIRKVKDRDGNVSKKGYTAAGINIHASYKILGRMTERETHSIIDLFMLDGRIDKEIAVDEVRNKWKLSTNDRRELSDFILTKYESDIVKKRKETQNDIKELLSDQLISMTTYSVLPPTMITGIAEQKKDKVKKVKIDKCPEIDITLYGTFNYAIYTQEVKDGNKIYTQVGTCYLDKKPNVMGVKKGKKELLPLIKSNTPLYIGKHKLMDAHATSVEKIKHTKDISFIFFYQPTHMYSEFERINLEFIYQSSFLGYKNIRVIADDKISASINKTTSQSIFSYDPDKKDDLNIELGDIKSNTTIFVGVSNTKKLNLKSNLFKGDDFDPDAEYILAKTEYREGETKYTSLNQFKTFSNKIGLYFTTLSVSLPEIKEPLTDENIKIIGVAEEKKGKVKKVYVSSTIPLDEGDNYKVYLKDKITKKAKEFAKLKIDELVNKYVAIADVKKGNKIIKPYTDGTKPVYTRKSDGGGLLGKVLRIAGSTDEFYSRILYVRGKSIRI